MAQVQLSYRYRLNDSFWFTFFHEIGHILLHRRHGLFIDFDGITDADQQETEANEFAAETLIPKEELSTFTQTKISEGRIRTFASQLGIHPGIVVGRLQRERAIPYRTTLNSLKSKLPG